MPDPIDRSKVLQKLCAACSNMGSFICMSCTITKIINDIPSIEVRQGYWIECDYKHMEHGIIETEPKAGFCCSVCHAAFQKKKMTYKQYCAACGARMSI